MRAAIFPAWVVLTISAAPVSVAQTPAPQRLLIVVDQGSLQREDCERVSAVVGALASAAGERRLEVVAVFGREARRPTPTEVAVRVSLCGSTAFLDSAAAKLTASEAYDIARRNEAVRDAVIHRLCGAAPAAGCGGDVGASALAVTRDLRQRSSEFVASLERLVIDSAPDVLVVISAGPPAPDIPGASRARLQDAVRKARVATLIVSPVPRTADALSSIQTRALDGLRGALGATVLPLEPSAVSPAFASLLSSHPTAAPSPPGDRLPDAARDPAHDIVARAAAHVAEFARQASVVLAIEEYDQQVKSRAGSFGLSGSTTMGITRQRRALRSEVALVQVLDGSLWMIARDVLSVDGRPLGERPSLGASIPTDNVEHALRYLRDVADAGARFNLGDIRRNLNTPTLALLPLLDAFRHRFAFRETAAKDRATVVLAFEERSEPTLFQINASSARTMGRLWVERETGAVTRSELVLASHQGTTARATITVDYEHVPAVDAWMPVKMTEKYEEPGKRESDWIECTATYSQFRRFRVTSQIR